MHRNTNKYVTKAVYNKGRSTQRVYNSIEQYRTKADPHREYILCSRVYIHVVKCTVLVGASFINQTLLAKPIFPDYYLQKI